MQDKPTILHVIDSLGRGGAETLLVGYIKDLKSYNHILVYLDENNAFEEELTGIKVIKLGFSNKMILPFYAFKLFNIIQKYKVNIIHSHLYWSTVVARIANLQKLPHLFSIHNKINHTVFLKHPYTKILEALTYNRKQIGVAVSHAVKEDYLASMKPAGEIKVLYNYIGDQFFSRMIREDSWDGKRELKLVAVGNLKGQKNYPFLIKAFAALRDKPVSLDIFGAGPMYDELQLLIEDLQVSSSVFLKGSVVEIEKALPEYDAFVMASTVEGFGLAPVEAMAIGLPLLLSNIDVLKEVASSNAYYFDPHDEMDFLQLIESILSGERELVKHVEPGLKYVKIFAKENYIKSLLSLYELSLISRS